MARVNKIPYGIRWICKQLAENAHAYFPDSGVAGVGALVGGFIFLRFFTPAIINPDTILTSNHKVGRKTRKNLVGIAKILQTLSNGTTFHPSKPLSPINGWLEDQKSRLQKYFQELIEIDRLEDRLEQDQ